MWCGTLEGDRMRAFAPRAGILLPEKLTSMIEYYMNAVDCVLEEFLDSNDMERAIELGWFLLENSTVTAIIDEEYGMQDFRKDMMEHLKHVTR